MLRNSQRARTGSIVIATFMCFLSATMLVAQAQEAPVTLKVGDTAPPLSNGKWLKGEPIKAMEPGKVYVLECWATWCGPCVAAIPHVTELQHKYEKDGLVVIGQNVWENDASASEPFVKQMGDKMDYHVVMDDGVGQDGQMAKTWMTAAGRNGIPCSFVIDRAGKIAWIGHPMAMEPVLKQVLAGTFDAQKNAAQEEAQKAVNQKLTEALRGGDMPGALVILDQMEKDNPDMAGRLEYTRFNLLLRTKDYDAAYKAGAKAAEALNDEPQALNALAWTIVDTAGLEKRDLDLALKAAERADSLTGHKDPQILDTLARVHFEKGNIDKAIEIEAKALDNATGEMKGELQKSMDKYKEAKSKQPA